MPATENKPAHFKTFRGPEYHFRKCTDQELAEKKADSVAMLQIPLVATAAGRYRGNIRVIEKIQAERAQKVVKIV